MKPGLTVWMIVIVLVLGGEAIYLYTKNQDLSKKIARAEPPTPTGAPSPKPRIVQGWKPCTNQELHFTLSYPAAIIPDSSCNYAPADISAVSDITVHDPESDLAKNWFITITAVRTNVDMYQWIKQIICPTDGRCSGFLPGGLPNSTEFDLLDVHYAETDTLAKYGNTIFRFALNARNPDVPVENGIRGVYDKIVSTFRTGD